MIPSVQTFTRQLHRRVNDGIHVRLLWCEHDGRAWVAVLDSKRGGEFCVEVGEGERALDVFHHPYAYAAHKQIDTGAAIEDATPTIALAA